MSFSHYPSFITLKSRNWIGQAGVGVGAVEVGGIILNCIQPHWVHSDEINTLPCLYCRLVLGIRRSQERHGSLGSQYLKHCFWILKSLWPYFTWLGIASSLFSHICTNVNINYTIVRHFFPFLHQGVTFWESFEENMKWPVLFHKHALTLKFPSGLSGLNVQIKDI